MNSWNDVALDKVAFFQEGPGVRKWQFRNEGIKLVNVRNIVDGHLFLGNTERFLSEEEVTTKYQHFLCDAGDLIMASSGVTWGKTAWVEEVHLPLCMNTSMIRFKALDSSSLDKFYLRWFLKSDLFTSQMNRLVTGSAQPNFGPSHLKQISIPLPPLEEQKRIGSILDKADAIRHKRKQTIKLADQFLRSVFLDMFGDPVTNPKGWGTSQLIDVTSKLGSGSTPRGGKEAYVDEGVSLIRSLNIHDDKFLLKKLAFLTDEQADGLSNVVVEHNDVLLNITGASVCRCAIVDKSVLPARVNQHVCIIRPNAGALLSEYLLHALISASFKRNLLNTAGAGGATREALTKNQVSKLTIPIPPLELQEKFREIVQKIMKNKVDVTSSGEMIDSLFSSLIHQTFKGELTQSKAA